MNEDKSPTRRYLFWAVCIENGIVRGSRIKAGHDCVVVGTDPSCDFVLRDFPRDRYVVLSGGTKVHLMIGSRLDTESGRHIRSDLDETVEIDPRLDKFLAITLAASRVLFVSYSRSAIWLRIKRILFDSRNLLRTWTP